MVFSRTRMLAAIATTVLATSAHSQTPAIYTEAQAAAGRAAYLSDCASCHLPDLAGRNEAPQLAGGKFMNVWAPRTAADLIRYTQATMPLSARGGLSEDTYTSIVAFFLQANGAPGGDRPLTVSTAVRIGAVAT